METPARPAGTVAWKAAAVPRVQREPNGPVLRRAARPGMYFDAVGNCSFVCGTENGPIEAWVWPWQILHGGKFAFRPEKSLQEIDLHKYAAEIEVEAGSTAIHYKSAEIFANIRYICPDGSRSVILLVALDVDKPGTFIFTWNPALQPQWPAAVGGVAAQFRRELGGFVFSEPSARVAAVAGSPWAARATEGMQYLLPDGELRIEMDVDPARCAKEFIPIVLCAADGKDAPAAAENYYRSQLDELTNIVNASDAAWTKRTSGLPVVTTENADVNRAFTWNCISLAQAAVRSAALGDGLVAGYGAAGARSQRPGFAWYFTGDVGLNAGAFLGAGLADLLETGLRFAARHQRADGKIPHEVVLSAALCDWFQQYPFAYIHGETTGIWIHSVARYINYTGNVNLLKELWPSVEKGCDWMLAQDADGDGLPDNEKAGMGASEIGPLRRDVVTDVYLAAASAVAMRDAARLAAVLGKNDFSVKMGRAFERAQTAIETRLFDSERQIYSYAILSNGSRSAEITPWPAILFCYELAAAGRAKATMDLIDSPDITTPWGARILSVKSEYYDPKGYNSGAVWPFITGIAALADFKTTRADAGWKKVISMAELTFSESLGRMPEVLSGNRPRSLDASVPHQLFSSMSVVAPVVEGLFGYDPDILKNTILLNPAFPQGSEGGSIQSLTFGTRRVSLSYHLHDGICDVDVQISGGAPPAPEIIFAPRGHRAGKVTVAVK